MRKPKRIHWSYEEVSLLRAVFIMREHMTNNDFIEDISSIAVLLNVDRKKVNIWFNNQRQRNVFERTLSDIVNIHFLAADVYFDETDINLVEDIYTQQH